MVKSRGSAKCGQCGVTTSRGCLSGDEATYCRNRIARLRTPQVDALALQCADEIDALSKRVAAAPNDFETYMIDAAQMAFAAASIRRLIDAVYGHPGASGRLRAAMSDAPRK